MKNTTLCYIENTKNQTLLLHRTKKKNGPQTGWPPCLQAAVLKAAVRRFAIISFRYYLSDE